MASLDRHTLSTRLEEHAKLAFRADCPYCREARLRGPFPSPEVVPRRAKAGLLAGMLAASAAAPAAPALGQPPASKGEAVAAVLPPGGIEAEDTGQAVDPPAVELGGAPTQAGPPVTGPRPEIKPPQAGVPPQLDPEESPTAPREATPEDHRAPGPGAEVEERAAAPVPEPPREEPHHDVAAPPPGGTAEQSGPRGDPLPGSEPERESVDGVPEAESDDERRSDGPADSGSVDSHRRSLTSVGPGPEDDAGAETDRDTVDRAPASEAEESPRAGSTAGRSVGESDSQDGVDARGGSGHDRSHATAGASAEAGAEAEAGRVHEVKPGESLWAIAELRLGPHAGDAEIAAEVNRLWELNDTEVIRTGDPDLILPGQRLRL